MVDAQVVVRRHPVPPVGEEVHLRPLAGDEQAQALGGGPVRDVEEQGGGALLSRLEHHLAIDEVRHPHRAVGPVRRPQVVPEYRLGAHHHPRTGVVLRHEIHGQELAGAAVLLAEALTGPRREVDDVLAPEGEDPQGDVPDVYPLADGPVRPFVP